MLTQVIGNKDLMLEVGFQKCGQNEKETNAEFSKKKNVQRLEEELHQIITEAEKNNIVFRWEKWV